MKKIITIYTCSGCGAEATTEDVGQQPVVVTRQPPALRGWLLVSPFLGAHGLGAGSDPDLLCVQCASTLPVPLIERLNACIDECDKLEERLFPPVPGRRPHPVQ